MAITLYVVLVIPFVLLMLIFLFWNDIMKFLYPQRYRNFFLIGKDNIIIKKTVKRDKVLQTFKHNNKTYVLPKSSAKIFEHNKIKSIFYEQDKAMPLSLIDKDQDNIDGSIIENLLEVKASELWKEDSQPIDNFLREYGLYLGIALIVIVILYFVFGRGG